MSTPRITRWTFSSVGTDEPPPNAPAPTPGQQQATGGDQTSTEDLRRQVEQLAQQLRTEQGRTRASTEEARKNAAAAKRLEEIEDAQRTAEERLTKKVTGLESDLDAARDEVVRLTAALEAGLSKDDLIWLPKGLKESDAAEAAKKLAERIQNAHRDDSPPDLDGGPRGGTSDGDPNRWANKAIRDARRR